MRRRELFTRSAEVREGGGGTESSHEEFRGKICGRRKDTSSELEMRLNEDVMKRKIGD